MSDTISARHAGGVEPWITARARVNRGWLAMPRHAIGGRHASPATRRGRRALDRLHGERHAWRHAWSAGRAARNRAAREAVAS